MAHTIIMRSNIHQSPKQILLPLVSFDTIHYIHWLQDQAISFMFCRTCRFASSYLSKFLWSDWYCERRPQSHGHPYRRSACCIKKDCQQKWLWHLIESTIQHIAIWASSLVRLILWTKGAWELNLQLSYYLDCKLEVLRLDLAHQCLHEGST